MAAAGPALRHPLSLAGVIITTASAAGFLALVAASLLGVFQNPYAGLVVFVALPAIFVSGLLLIPFGLRSTDGRRDRQEFPASRVSQIDVDPRRRHEESPS